MGSFSTSVRNSWLDALARGVSYVNAEIWVQLHVGDPSASGIDNPAANTIRVQATFGVAAAIGEISNTLQVAWTNAPARETYTHVSLWSASTGGTFLGRDDLAVATTVLIGESFAIPIGDLDLAVTE